MTSSIELITNALTETFGHEVEGIAPDRTLQDLELDSLASVEMALMLQEQTGIPLDDLTPETTIGELADRIDTARAGAAVAASVDRSA
ncbi:acyl carrier protein [Streptomyces sp. NPDC053429]|uniref:acyl carrier protein n=1 Tax=unclassified Streptomyces TaxID=2593676 RepID=UPI0033C35132